MSIEELEQLQRLLSRFISVTPDGDKKAQARDTYSDVTNTLQTLRAFARN